MVQGHHSEFTLRLTDQLLFPDDVAELPAGGKIPLLK
jgi:hypothetical protein